jgi:hypothetical protein
MDEDDFRAIIEVLIGELRAIGADEVADEANYVVANPETGDGELMEPQERLTEMLLAFERFLAVRDGSVARDALERIQTELRASSRTVSTAIPNGAVVVVAAEREFTRGEVNLLNAPDLKPLRAQVHVLVQQLQPPDRGPPPAARTAR